MSCSRSSIAWLLALAAASATASATACKGGGSSSADRDGATSPAADAADCGADCPDGAGDGDAAAAPGDGEALVVAYVNCLCGFGAGSLDGACLDDPDPAVNHVKTWEDAGQSPITHYVLSFLSFQGSQIQTDPGAIWADGGGSTSQFGLAAGLLDAMRSAQGRGKRVVLSLGGELGSSGFLAWWSGLGGSTDERVAGMRAELERVAQAFEEQNGVAVDGFDVDIELGGVYSFGSDKYDATRDLINAVPDRFFVAFVPQIGNGLCAAPVAGDPLDPPTVLGGQCQQPVNGDDSAWVLARLDQDCRRVDDRPKLDYFGIQYYNAGQAECCGGGADEAAMIRSAVQSYVNLANGWPAAGDVADPDNPWHEWQFFPGPWPAFAGIGTQRLVLGKPGCQGCAGSDFLSLESMREVIAELDGRLDGPMGGILFWDLCRLFGNTGPQCVGGICQPSWGGPDVLENLTDLRRRMAELRPRASATSEIAR
ncbi:MAG TPA: hypothetical protein VKB80_29650 [Kofleriaceae bacterium]|nr:hypothetical protein [Kofleriaceae bacterium]